MSETAPLPRRTSGVSEAPPVQPTPQKGGERQQQSTAQQNGAASAGTSAQAPPFKDPAISLSPRVAGIAVGDVLQGTVERIDQQHRAVVQNGRETLLVDPAADLKTGTAAKVRVTQTVPVFLGQLLNQGAKANSGVQVRLALVAVRGLELAPPQAGANAPLPAGEAPKTATLIAAAGQQPNRLQDILSAFTQPAGGIKVPPQPQQTGVTSPTSVPPSAPQTQVATSAQNAAAPAARPTLLQAIVSRASSAPTAPNLVPFTARHPDINAAPKPLTMTLLPASSAQASYARTPAATTPLGQLIASGRAVMATVQETPAPQAPATARMTLAAGPLRIEIPALPDMPLRAGEKVVLLSASAAPLPQKPAQPGQHPLTPQPSGKPVTTAPQIAMGSAIAWPALQNTLAGTAALNSGLSLSLFTSRTTQLLSAVLGLSAPEAAQHMRSIQMPAALKEKLSADVPLRAALDALVQSKPELERLWANQFDPAQQALTAAPALRPDALALPLVLPNSEASLIASLFLYPADHAQGSDADSNGARSGGEEAAQSFEVALTFDRFGLTKVSGTFAGDALSLDIETEQPLPQALQSELAKLFTDQCTACSFTGAIVFQSAA